MAIETKKKCSTCEQEKYLSDFNKNKNTKDGYEQSCRECRNTQMREYYQKNKERQKELITKRKKDMIRKNRLNLFEYYKNNPCVDCGEDDPIVLESDHRDGVDKKGIISEMIWTNGWDTIKEELDKCDTRCSNCHKRRTAKQQGWYKNIL
jgi:hypothetical protein